VHELAKNFVAAADAVEPYQKAKPPRSPEAELFWKIAEQKGDGQGLPGQGVYVATPSGKLLAYRQRDHDPASIAGMMAQALKTWRGLAPEDRSSADAPSLDPEWRRSAKPPEGGLVLELFVRDLPRTSGVDPRYAEMWNRDVAWFTLEEIRSMIPPSRKPGDRHLVPERLVRRLARLHLLDSVRGINDARPFEDRDVQKAEMGVVVTGLVGDLLHLRIEGATRAVEPPLPLVRPSPVDDKERGFEARLLGRARFNLKEERFLSFDLVAVGPRWGGRGYSHSMRADDLGPQPMGVAFRVAPPEVAARAAPLHGSNYFDR
jgi:hypothetical protein